MARTTNQPSTATQRNTTSAQPKADAHGQLDEQNRPGDNGERRENGLSSVRDEQDQFNDSPQNRENRDERTSGEKRGFGDNRDRREQLGERDEQDSRGEQWAMSGAEAYAPVLDAWKQVFKSWSDLAETMVKAQQQSFAAMMGAAQGTAKDITDSDHRGREHALSGSRSDSRASEQIDNDRR